MPCIQQQVTSDGAAATPTTGPYRTKEDCLQACKEGACCEGTTCSIKPQCQCQGTGQVFNGVGTTCTAANCPQACGEGACCEGATCSIKSKCQCQGTGQVFKGVETTCGPNPCLLCAGFCNENALPQSISFTFTGFGQSAPSWVSDQFSGATWQIPLTSTCFLYSGAFDHDWTGSSCYHDNCIAAKCPKLVVIANFYTSSVALTARISSITPCDNGYSWNNVSINISRYSVLCNGQPFSGTLSAIYNTGNFFASFSINANPLP